MYTNLELAIILTCIAFFVPCYIYLRATNTIWGYINWKLLKKRIFRAIYKFACKMSK